MISVLILLLVFDFRRYGVVSGAQLRGWYQLRKPPGHRPEVS